MPETTDDELSLETLSAIARALDTADTMHGPLAQDSRARIFAAIETPGRDTWTAARSCIVGKRGFRTLWNLVADHTGITDADFTPTRRHIIDALTARRGD